MQTFNLPHLSVAAAVMMALYGAPLMAQSSAGKDAALEEGPLLEEIIVTAQKRPEKLQDITVSAAVLSVADLANNNISDVADLNKMVPSVNMNQNLNGRTPMAIRGISTVSNEAAIGISSGVAILVDGVPVPADSNAGNSLEDVQRVEVLKGPQATLGGRTASAGVINIVTRGPTGEFGADGSATVTDDNERRINVFVAGPIGNALGFSLAGWDRHTEFPMKNLQTGEKTTNESAGARAKLLFKAGDDTNIMLTGRLSQNKTDGSNFVYAYVTPGAQLFPYLDFNGDNVPDGVGIPQSLAFPGFTPKFNNTLYSSPVRTEQSLAHDGDVSLNIDHSFNDYTFTSTTAYQRDHQSNSQDLFITDQYFWNYLFHTIGGVPVGFGPPDFDDTQAIDQVSKQISQELKIASPSSNPLNYVAGAFFSRTKVTADQQRAWVANPQNFVVTSDTSTYDLYGRLTWKFVPTTSLIVGLRYNYDVVKYDTNQIANGSAGVQASQGSDSTGTTVGDFNLQHYFESDVMVYATYARGYKPKAYNTGAPLTSNTPRTPVDKENINHYELGTKGTYLNGSLRLNAAIFDTIYSGYQVQTYAATGFGPQLDLRNAGKAETKGVELDAEYAATRNLKLNMSAAYIDAKFKTFKNADCYGGQLATGTGCTLFSNNGTPANPADDVYTQDISGKTMPLSPKFKGVVGIEDTVPLTSIADGYDLVLRADYSYRSKQQFQVDQNPQTIAPAFGLLNLSATLKQESDKAKFSISVFANNVLDKYYVTDMQDFFSGLWATPTFNAPGGGFSGFVPGNAVISQPARDSHRYFGLRLTAGF